MKRVFAAGIIALGLAATAVLDIGRANAADWHWDPRVDVGGTYNDNYGLSSAPSAQIVSVAGSFVSASLQASIAEPSTQFEVTPTLRLIEYPGHSEFESDDQFVNSRFSHEWQSADFALDEYYSRQELLQSYLPSTNISTPLGQGSGGGDIGPVNERIRQDSLQLSPSATFVLGPRERLEVRAQYLDANYSQQINNERQNWKSYSGGLGFGFAITPRSTVMVRGVASELIPGSGSDANTYGAQIEWKSRLSERMQAYARLGVDHTTFNQNLYGDSSATNISGGLGISRQFVVNDLFVDLTRSVSPSSFAEVVARDELRLRIEHKFGPRSSGYIGLRGIKEQALGSGVGFTNDSYGLAALGFEWRIFRQFSIVSEYAYTMLRTYNVPGTAGANSATRTAGANSVTITLVYQPRRPAEEFGVRIAK
jgi:hypothetical protein